MLDISRAFAQHYNTTSCHHHDRPLVLGHFAIIKRQAYNPTHYVVEEGCIAIESAVCPPYPSHHISTRQSRSTIQDPRRTPDCQPWRVDGPMRRRRRRRRLRRQTATQLPQELALTPASSPARTSTARKSRFGACSRTMGAMPRGKTTTGYRECS